MEKITLEKIAKDIGVSKVAVFKALNDRKGVGEDLRRRIKDYAASLGYAGKSVSPGVCEKRFLYFIDKDFFLTPSEQFYSTIFYFLTSECGKSGCTLQIAFLEPEDTLAKMKAVIATFRPDGIYLAGEVPSSVIRLLSEGSVPVVHIDYFSPLYNGNYVYVDNYHLSYSLTEYLIAKGHTHIGFVGDIRKTSSIADRFFGYCKALNEHNLPIVDLWHVNVNMERNTEIATLPIEKLPTAFLCHCDAAAQWLYAALALKGIHIPEDISVISFDNTALCDSLMPRLTSAGPQKDLYAKKAFAVMAECLANRNRNVSYQMKTPLAERDSVKTIGQ